VVGDLFGQKSDAAAVGLPRAPLDEIFVAPAVRVVEARSGFVLTKSPARVALGSDGRIAEVRAGAVAIATRCVISTVPWHALGRIWADEPPAAVADILERAGRMESLPIVSANLWCDRPILPAPFIGLVGGPMQWAFDKAAIFGGRAGHISVVASAAASIVREENQAIARMAKAALDRAIPGSRDARLERSTVVREHRATFSLAPGQPARPATRTPLEGFYLAGDWIDTGLPATIEGAALSARWAAEAVLDDLRADARTERSAGSRP
jgi:hypothetical protein